MHNKPANVFNITFFGSSEFVVPILVDIKNSSKLTLREVFLRQLEKLEIMEKVTPSWWMVHKSDLINLVESDPAFDKKPHLKVIVSQPDRLNRSKIVSNPVVIFARKHNLELFLPEKINQVKTEFKESFAEDLDLGIIASYGQIISVDILNMAKYGFVNWHPSLLPKYRGATPMQTALKHGDPNSGLSWINMTKAMDAGNIWIQLDKNLSGIRNFAELAIEKGHLGADTWSLVVVAKILETIVNESYSWLESIVQDESQVTFCKMLTKEDRMVDPKLMTAAEIYNQFRGFSSFPGTVFWDSYFGEEIKILDCRIPGELEDMKVARRYDDWWQIKAGRQYRVFLKCKDQTLLEIFKIGRAGGKQLEFSGFQFC
jgi:methionyl-tRNA formyltransferase